MRCCAAFYGNTIFSVVFVFCHCWYILKGMHNQNVFERKHSFQFGRVNVMRCISVINQVGGGWEHNCMLSPLNGFDHQCKYSQYWLAATCLLHPKCYIVTLITCHMHIPAKHSQSPQNLTKTPHKHLNCVASSHVATILEV